MKPVLALAIAFTLFGLLSCPLLQAQETPKPAAPDGGLQELQGTWEGTEAGRETKGKATLTISGNSIELQGADKREWYKATFTLPAGTNPKQLHGTITESPMPEFVGKTGISIYKVENGTLTLTGSKPGSAEVPKNFQGEADTRTFVFKKAAAQK